MSIKIKQTHIVVYPVGEYLAKIESIVEKSGDYGPQVQIAFRLDAGDPDASPLLGWCSQTFSNKSKLYAWTKAAFGGGPIPPDYDFNSDDLIEKLVILTLVIRTREDGTDFNRIDSVKSTNSSKKQGNKESAREPEIPF